MKVQTTLDLETLYGTLEDVPIIYSVKVEDYPAENFSWGGTRGTEREVDIDLEMIMGLPAGTVAQPLGLNLRGLEESLEALHDA